MFKEFYFTRKSGNHCRHACCTWSDCSWTCRAHSARLYADRAKDVGCDGESRVATNTIREGHEDTSYPDRNIKM